MSTISFKSVGIRIITLLLIGYIKVIDNVSTINFICLFCFPQEKTYFRFSLKLLIQINSSTNENQSLEDKIRIISLFKNVYSVHCFD